MSAAVATVPANLPSLFLPPNYSFSSHRRQFPPRTTFSPISTLTRFPSLRCYCKHPSLRSSSSFSSSSIPKLLDFAFHKPSIPLPLRKPLALTAASGVLLALYSGGGGGIFGGGGSGGDGGGGGPGGSGESNFWSNLLTTPPAYAKEDESESREWDPHGLPANIALGLERLDPFKKYKISNISFFDNLELKIIDPKEIFFEIDVQSGGIYTRSELQKKLEILSSCGLLEKVDFDAKTYPDGTVGLVVSFKQMTWPGTKKFKCINVGLLPMPKAVEADPNMDEIEMLRQARNQDKDLQMRMKKSRPCMLPTWLEREINEMLKAEHTLSSRMLSKIQAKIARWYHDHGYTCAQVVNFGNLHRGEIVCEVFEGDITQLVVQFKDKLGNVCEGNTQLGVIRRVLPAKLQPGNVFNFEEGRKAMQNLHDLALFSNIDVGLDQDEKNEGGCIVKIDLVEAEQKSADVSTEWSIIPGRGGRPTLASIHPGGTVSFEHRNLKGFNRSILGSIRTSNFLHPQDDLEFKVDYVHPYLDGLYDSRDRTLHTTCFNSKKFSPVFTGGPDLDEVPSIWVDRSGIKANITENFTSQSKFTYGIVMEEITTRDESRYISANSRRVLPNGSITADGPPTTLSGTGIDRMAFLQANITRDNTKFVNGTPVGERNVFQLDQGLGIGSKNPFFNRHQLTLTRFIQLKKVEEGAGKPPPPVLVLHGHYGGCVGDLPIYDAFTLGGPYSVRGYSMGEIGAARNILEVAAELRIPVRKDTHMYVFAEHGNDLGSSKDVKGNPTQVYRRMGKGSSYGMGVKLGQLRAEYAVDHNSGTGDIYFRFGDRF